MVHFKKYYVISYLQVAEPLPVHVTSTKILLAYKNGNFLERNKM